MRTGARRRMGGREGAEGANSREQGAVKSAASPCPAEAQCVCAYEHFIIL